MRRLSFLLIALFIFSFSFAQTPGVQWMNSIGGTSSDRGGGAFVTNDSGYLFIGTTFSNDLDATGSYGFLGDVWVIKTDRSGTIQWKKTYGGTSTDQYKIAFYNADGTTTIVANTNSNDNDVSGFHGGGDIWIFNIDADGNINWQRCLGGTNSEAASDASVMSDGSYVISGVTDSNDGDVSGNHGSNDMWVVKVSGTGVLQWQKCLGGSGNEMAGQIKALTDGNIVLNATTTSGNGDVTGYHGSFDMWLVKLNNLGNIVWQRACGSSGFDQPYAIAYSAVDNLVVMTGQTNGQDGDVSGNHDPFGFDAWLIALNYTTGAFSWQRCIGGTGFDAGTNLTINNNGDILAVVGTNSVDGDAIDHHGAGNSDILLAKLNPAGAVQWKKCYGGSRYEAAMNIFNDTAVNEYLIVAYTSSPDGDVTGYHPLSAFPSDTTHDGWLFKVDYSGNIKWQKALGGSDEDDLYFAAKTGNNEFIVVGEARSGDGDLQYSLGELDFWMVKVGAVNTIKGTLYRDINSNGVKDTDDPPFSEALVQTQKGTTIRRAFPFNGEFQFDADTGNHVTTLQLALPYYNVVPSSHNSSFTAYFTTDSFSFALQPIAGIRDLVINLMPMDIARPGFPLTYKISYKNAGTDTVSAGEILFAKNSHLDFNSAFPAVGSTSGDTLKWSYTDLKPLDSATIILNMTVHSPPLVNLGDTLTSVAIITPIAGDQTPFDDTAVVKQIARASVDPNDKYENNEGKIFPEYITSGKYLDYLVRFQNIGSDTAYNVVIRDTLDAKLNLSSLQVIAASHSYSVSVSGNILIWTFRNIRLPYSSIDEPASHGFIAYRIKPNGSVVAGDTIHNTAAIYFDFNLPIATNDAFTIVVSNIILPVNLLSFSGVYKDDKASLYWSTTREFDVEKFVVERSIDASHYIPVGEVLPIGGLNSITKYEFIDRLSGVNGNVFYYRLKMVDRNGTIKYSRVILLQRNSKTNSAITVNPNPVNDFAVLNIRSALKTPITISVVDVSGRVVVKQQDNMFEGNNAVPVNNLGKLQPGFYTFVVTYADKKMTAPFIIRR